MNNSKFSYQDQGIMKKGIAVSLIDLKVIFSNLYYKKNFSVFFIRGDSNYFGKTWITIGIANKRLDSRNEVE